MERARSMENKRVGITYIFIIFTCITFILDKKEQTRMKKIIWGGVRGIKTTKEAF